MKVCYVTHLPNLTGASQSLLDLLDGLKGTEVEPVVLLSKSGPLEKELKKRDIPYETIRFANEVRKDTSAMHTARKNALNLAVRPAVKSFLRREHVDLVHNNSMFTGLGMECAKELGLPYIAHVREYVEEDHHLALEHPKRMAKLAQDADCVLAVSETLAKAAAVKYGVPAENIVSLYDGLQTDRYQVAPEEREPLFSGERTELLLAGRIVPGKGQKDAVLAMAELDRITPGAFHLTLAGPVGDEAYEKELRTLAEPLSEEAITFLPFVEDLTELRKQTDIALVCSESEALGRVTVESMLSGCLVIGANGGATPELLAEGRGFLYPAGDAPALAFSILALGEADAEDLRQKQEAARSWAADRFDAKAYAADVLKLYKGILTQ